MPVLHASCFPLRSPATATRCTVTHANLVPRGFTGRTKNLHRGPGKAFLPWVHGSCGSHSSGGTGNQKGHAGQHPPQDGDEFAGTAGLGVKGVRGPNAHDCSPHDRSPPCPRKDLMSDRIIRGPTRPPTSPASDPPFRRPDHPPTCLRPDLPRVGGPPLDARSVTRTPSRSLPRARPPWPAAPYWPKGPTPSSWRRSILTNSRSWWRCSPVFTRQRDPVPSRTDPSPIRADLTPHVQTSLLTRARATHRGRPRAIR